MNKEYVPIKQKKVSVKKIWKLENFEQLSDQEPDDQNEVNEDNEIQDTTD